jgi:hypothetical protein
MVFAFSLMDMQTGARRARLTTGERGVYFERHSTGLPSTAGAAAAFSDSGTDKPNAGTNLQEHKNTAAHVDFDMVVSTYQY